MDGGPEQYLIWNIIDEKVIESIRFDD